MNNLDKQKKPENKQDPEVLKKHKQLQDRADKLQEAIQNSLEPKDQLELLFKNKFINEESYRMAKLYLLRQ